MAAKRAPKLKISTSEPSLTPEQQVLVDRYGPGGRYMRKRTRDETNDFLEMIARQGAEAEKRGLRILADYEQDAERRAMDAVRSGRVFDAPFAERSPELKGRGHSLREWIADRTKAVLGGKRD